MEDSVKEILRKMRRHTLSSPVRLVIALLLFVRGGMEFNELQRALELAPGTLWSHLIKLSEDGIVRLRRRLTPFGPRLVIDLTDKGREIVVDYIKDLDKLISLLSNERERSHRGSA